MYKPWLFEFDKNKDGIFTISDISELIKQFIFLPGDCFFYFLINFMPSIAQFFEITTNSYHGLYSGIISLAVWLSFLISVIFIYVTAADKLHKKISDRQKYGKLTYIELKRKKMGYDENDKD